jgi:hypothetical protein
MCGFDDCALVSPSSLKTMPWPCLVSNFSSEVSSWFIDDSFEETSSTSTVSSSGELEESSSLSSLSEGHSLFLTVKDSTSSSDLRLLLVSLDAILWRRESLERERVIGWTYERGRSATQTFIAAIGGIFEEMPRSWGAALQIHSSNELMISYPLLQ